MNCSYKTLQTFAPEANQQEKMTVVLIRIGVDAERRYELLQTLMAEARTKELPEGCLERRLYEEVDSHLEKLLLIGSWSNRDVLNAYVSSEKFQVLMGAVKVLGSLEDLRILDESTPGESGAREQQAIEILRQEFLARERKSKDKKEDC
jgi:quinol monooxygenase YgiN